ncbi:MAG: hypothetical protein WC455_11805 [Dehalococcoidia bacterium]|jgi:hypothetical protein
MFDSKSIDSIEGWKEFIAERKPYAEVSRHPVVEWGDCKYILTGKIKLQQGLQRLEVIDVTNLSNLLLVHEWPGISASIPCDHAIVIWPDEGHISVILNDGSNQWVHLADLAIHVIPGTASDAKQVQEQQLDELEASIDAGGHLDI